MHIPDQTFKDKETLIEMLEEFSSASGGIDTYYLEIVEQYNKELNSNEDVATDVDGMDDSQRMNLYDGLLADRVIPLFLERYEHFEVENYRLYGYVAGKRELLTWIEY